MGSVVLTVFEENDEELGCEVKVIKPFSFLTEVTPSYSLGDPSGMKTVSIGMKIDPPTKEFHQWKPNLSTFSQPFAGRASGGFCKSKMPSPKSAGRLR
jgi:hypothetical protein